MSDRTSASIFSRLFRHLAEVPDDRARAFARVMWGEIGEYDFSPYQMGADDALMVLGLARKLDCGCLLYEGDEHDPGYCEAKP